MPVESYNQSMLIAITEHDGGVYYHFDVVNSN